MPTSSSFVVRQLLRDKARLLTERAALDQRAKEAAMTLRHESWNLARLLSPRINLDEHVVEDVDITYGELLEQGEAEDAAAQERYHASLHIIQAERKRLDRRLQMWEHRWKRACRQTYVAL